MAVLELDGACADALLAMARPAINEVEDFLAMAVGSKAGQKVLHQMHYARYGPWGGDRGLLQGWRMNFG